MIPPDDGQPGLFDDSDDICARNHGGNECSMEANESLVNDKNYLRSQVMASIRRHGPSTCEEVEGMLGMKHQTISARMTELKAMGAIHAVGKRPTSSGRNANVFEVSDGNA